jgi:Uma2 family endonuclease
MIGALEEQAELMTAEQLLTYHAPDKCVELVRGRLVLKEPPGWQHGEVMARMSVVLSNHLLQEQAAHALPAPRGRVACGDPGFTLFRAPDTVRAPDVAYVARDRLARPTPRGFPELAPDLAVEIRSPGDRTGEVLAKVADWLNAGSLLVWVIDPGRRIATVYRADGSMRMLEPDDALEGEDVLPGFSCPLRALITDE